MLPDLEASLIRLMLSPPDAVWLTALATSVLDHHPLKPFHPHAFANRFRVNKAHLRRRMSGPWGYQARDLGKNDLDFARALP